MGRQLWIADRCRVFGLQVIEVDGWQTHGTTTFNPHGVVCHHTGGSTKDDMPSLKTLVHGRSDLPGPLCQVGLSRSGVVYVVASGRANHAGKGSWKGLNCNTDVFGIEAENSGTQPWPAKQVGAYQRLAAALISGPGVGGDVACVCAHREWAPKRKPDPHGIDMGAFRQKVQEVFAGNGKTEEVDDVYVKLGASIYQIVGGVRVKIGTGDPGTRRWLALQAAGAKAITVKADHPLIKEFPEFKQ